MTSHVTHHRRLSTTVGEEVRAFVQHPLPPLVRFGLAYVQFETIHPFLDGNGRIGRLLVTLFVEHWRLLDAPLLYLSLALKSMVSLN